VYTSRPFTPFQTVFGTGYLPEQHIDATHGYLPTPEHVEISVKWEELLKKLRAALSLR
jgi:hypothetical protein